MLITKLLEANQNTNWEDEHEDVQVGEEPGPCSRLMLGNRRNDRDVPRATSEDIQGRDRIHLLFGVASIPERVEPPGPGSNPPFHRQDDNPDESDNTSTN